MPRVTLICSAHRESGLCNAEELLALLQSIGPDVIFEEVRDALQFDQLYAHGSVEALAIARYRASKHVRQVPIDQYDIPERLLFEIKNGFDRVLALVSERSREYQLLDEENGKCVYQRGFNYLNSAACSTISRRLSELEEVVVRESSDPDLLVALEQWRRFTKKRELGMVRSIYQYTRNNCFDEGVFLVGSAHRADLAREIEKYVSAEPSLIRWTYYNSDRTS